MLVCIVMALKFRAYSFSISLDTSYFFPCRSHRCTIDTLQKTNGVFWAQQGSVKKAAWKCPYLHCRSTLILEGSYYTHGKQSITLCISCEPSQRALMANIPVNCLFSQDHYQRWTQSTEWHLCYIDCMQQCYWCVNSH